MGMTGGLPGKGAQGSGGDKGGIPEVTGRHGDGNVMRA